MIKIVTFIFECGAEVDYTVARLFYNVSYLGSEDVTTLDIPEWTP